MTNDFSFSFADDQFKEPERPKFIYQQIGVRIAVPDETEKADYKQKYGKEPDTAFVLVVKPISYSLKDGKETFDKRFPLKHDKSGKLWNFKLSWEAATKIKAVKQEDFEKANGLFFEGQDTVLPSWVKRNTTDDKPTFLKVLRVVTDEEAERVIEEAKKRNQPRPESPADEDAATDADSIETKVLALVGEGGTLDEVKTRYRESGDQDTTLYAGIVRGKLLERLVSDGLLTKDGDRYVPGEAAA